MLDQNCTSEKLYHLKEQLVLNPVNFTASHLDTYIKSYSHLNKER